MTSIIVTGFVGMLMALGAPDAGAKASRDDTRFLGARICKQVDCTPSQERRIADIFAAHREEVAGDRTEVERLRGEMAAAFAESELDTDALRRLQTQLSRVRARMAQARLRSMIELHDVLTPTQRRALAEDLATRGAGSPRARGRGGGRGRGRGPGR
jgi:Spy/CpxP family protein refolding chaperone